MLKNVIVGACAVVLLAGLWLFLKPPKVQDIREDLSLSYHLSVTNGVVVGPAVLIAREGFPVEIVVSSDRDDVVHLHGYELQQLIVAGQPLSLSFTTVLVGRYLLELENSGIPLASLEVYPK